MLEPMRTKRFIARYFVYDKKIIGCLVPPREKCTGGSSNHTMAREVQDNEVYGIPSLPAAFLISALFFCKSLKISKNPEEAAGEKAFSSSESLKLESIPSLRRA